MGATREGDTERFEPRDDARRDGDGAAPGEAAGADTGSTDPAQRHGGEDDLPAQEPAGDAMGSVRDSDRVDPMTGTVLGDDETPVSNNPAGARYGRPGGEGDLEEDLTRPPGRPSSTPRQEQSLRDMLDP